MNPLFLVMIAANLGTLLATIIVHVRDRVRSHRADDRLVAYDRRLSALENTLHPLPDVDHTNGVARMPGEYPIGATALDGGW